MHSHTRLINRNFNIYCIAHVPTWPQLLGWTQGPQLGPWSNASDYPSLRWRESKKNICSMLEVFIHGATKTLGLYVGPTVSIGTAWCADFGRGVRCRKQISCADAWCYRSTKHGWNFCFVSLFDERGLLNHAPIWSFFRECLSMQCD
jgi:hypothetical protein